MTAIAQLCAIRARQRAWTMPQLICRAQHAVNREAIVAEDPLADYGTKKSKIQRRTFGKLFVDADCYVEYGVRAQITRDEGELNESNSN